MTGFKSRLLLALAGVLVMAGCGEPEPLNPASNISDYVSAVSARDGSVSGVVVAGALPAGGSGPTVSVSGISSVINGGSTQVGLTGSDEFQRVLVSILGVDGYYSVTLPSGTSAEDLVMSMGTGLNAGSVRVRYMLEGPSGIGPMAEQTVRVIRVGSGDVQISVAWADTADVDLHVIDPSGERIYYAHPTSASGGTLDLDSNAACRRDNVNNENVVWPANGAPAGEYVVVLDYWSNCNLARTDWVVTVQVKGRAPQTFTGHFEGPGGPEHEVTRFTY